MLPDLYFYCTFTILINLQEYGRQCRRLMWNTLNWIFYNNRLDEHLQSNRRWLVLLYIYICGHDSSNIFHSLFIRKYIGIFILVFLLLNWFFSRMCGLWILPSALRTDIYRVHNAYLIKWTYCNRLILYFWSIYTAK